MVPVIQKRQVVEMLMTSFAGNVRMLSMLRSSHQKHLNIFFDYIYVFVDQIGQIFISGKKSTVLLYFQKSKQKHNAKTYSALLRLFFFSISWKNILQTLTVNRAIAQTRTCEAMASGDRDYLYVWFLAGRDHSAGYRGLYEAMKHLKKVSLEAQLSVYIETTVPRMLPIYRRAGFRFYKEAVCGNQLVWFAKYQNDEK